MPLNEDLRRALLTMAAQLEIEQVDPRDAVLLACDLLAAGASGAATVELAIQPPATLHPNHAEDLLRPMLREWDVDAPDQPRSAEIVAVDLGRRFLAGAVAAESAGHRLLGALAQAGDRVLADRLVRLLDRLEDDLQGRADEPFRADLAALARDVVQRWPGP